MKAAIVIFPGINRERDMALALERVTDKVPEMVWHGDSALPDCDLVVLPGGFSYGDYLRCGAIAARAAVMPAVAAHVAQGRKVLGVCNGFQILLEAGLLPGALMRNANLKFVCRNVRLKIENADTFLTRRMARGDTVTCPVAHGDGNYVANDDTIKMLEDNRQVVFRYADGTNPNGSTGDIAGICNAAGTVIGMMPHPENMIEPHHGVTDCLVLFESLLEAA